MDKFYVGDNKPRILDHKISEVVDEPGKWQLEVDAVKASDLTLGKFPVEVRRFIMSQGPKEKMEALWNSLCEKT